jgi:hypothetical protein
MVASSALRSAADALAAPQKGKGKMRIQAYKTEGWGAPGFGRLPFAVVPRRGETVSLEEASDLEISEAATDDFPEAEYAALGAEFLRRNPGGVFVRSRIQTAGTLARRGGITRAAAEAVGWDLSSLRLLFGGGYWAELETAYARSQRVTLEEALQALGIDRDAETIAAVAAGFRSRPEAREAAGWIRVSEGREFARWERGEIRVSESYCRGWHGRLEGPDTRDGYPCISEIGGQP